MLVIGAWGGSRTTDNPEIRKEDIKRSVQATVQGSYVIVRV